MQVKPSRHTPSASSSSHTLPPRYTVPPLPPTIHRKLALYLHDDYLLIVPWRDEAEASPSEDGIDKGEEESVRGVKIGWGVKGKVEAWEGTLDTDEGDAIELGGVLGLVRLWDGEPEFPEQSMRLRVDFLCSRIPPGRSAIYEGAISPVSRSYQPKH